jgi:Tol biopolymer transport system component/tRNA A-37 threonylcarbamoyl transferase component Bud32
MPLTSGTRLGAYAIAEMIDAGGMGEVYRAIDTRLDRLVAIKVLPDAFRHDPDRVARFEREAKLLATLNHPNIASIYGFEQVGREQFIVMELVEGETLADRITRGPIPVPEAVAIAKQLADALETAHEKGIIHRDLKPANVKLTADDHVKVLDFGLAKAFAPDASQASAVSLTNSPTLTGPVGVTAVGVLLGTAAYMAPEQARGKAVDKRADIFSFGCVLYEMLTGRQAFAGEDTADTLGRVLQREPDLSVLPANTPNHLRRLISRCLTKDRKRRLADIADARLDLEEAETSHTTLPRPMGLARRERSLWAAALVMSILASIFGARFLRAPVDLLPETRLEVATGGAGSVGAFTLSPDGRFIVIAAVVDGQQRLQLRSLETGDTRVIAGTDTGSLPFWSPDSKSIGFFNSEGLQRVDIDGGAPRFLVRAPGNRGGTWGPDGTILFVPAGAGRLSRVSERGGAVESQVFDSPYQFRFPQVLPDGRQFLVYLAGTVEEQGIYLGSADSTTLRRVTAADSAALYMPGGWLAFVREGVLLAQRFNMGQGEVAGEPVALAREIAVGVNHNGAFSVSAAGPIAYRTAIEREQQLTWFDRAGTPTGTLGSLDRGTVQSVDLSPDSVRALVHGMQEKGNLDIAVVDSSSRQRLTVDPGVDQFPIWSPDGESIAFDSTRNGRRDLYVRRLNRGVGTEELLLATAVNKATADWHRNGSLLYSSTTTPNGAWDLWVLPIDPSGKPGKEWPFLATGANECCGQFSPDGRWIAYQSNQTQNWEVYVRPFPAGTDEWPVSVSGGTKPRWSHDGKELYYVAPEGVLIARSVAVEGNTLRLSPPSKLFQVRMFGETNMVSRQQFDVAPGGRFLVNLLTGDDRSVPISVLLNWRPPK